MAVEAHDVPALRLGAFIGEVTFLPADPPRDAAFALWRPAPGFVPHARVRLWTAGSHGVTAEELEAGLAPVSAAIPWLVQTPIRGSASLLAWRAAVRSGLALVARGRLRPSVSPAGYDCWAVGPLDDDDAGLLAALAGALPAQAHAVPLPGDPSRVYGPAALIHACWDSIADTLPRTAGAEVAFGGPLFSHPTPHPVRHMVSRLLPGGEMDETVVRLRVRLPAGAAPRLELDRPLATGYEALAALHRGSRRWRPLERLVANGATMLAHAELEDLLDARPSLREVGVDVALPEMEAAEVRAVVGSEAEVDRPVLRLDALLDFRWELAVGSERLTDAEVAELARSNRRLVRFRDRWLQVDPELLDLTRREPRRELPAAEALAAALTGTMIVGGRSLNASAAGRVAALAGRLRELAGPREEPEPEGFSGALRGYQRRGLAWLRDLCELGLGGCLADDMGLGKTIQVIALHLARRGGPMLVVCPASLIGNWESELHAFAPAERVRRYHGEARELDDLGPGEVTLTTYGVLRRDGARLAEVQWGLVVADEAQQVKNAASAAARELRRLPARARIALTGTPVENRLLDLWAILDWTTPGLLGSRQAFADWTAAIDRGADEMAETRLRRLVQPFLLRRRKSDPGVAPELPPRIETDHMVALTPEQVGLYEALIRETESTIRSSEGIQRRGLVLKLITLLKQVCNHPAQYLREKGPLAGRSGKLDALDDLLEVILDDGESVLLFTQYVEMGRLLERHLRGRCATTFLHGGVPARRRDEMVRRFQAGQVPVLLVSLRAGGFGLNLTRASHVVHFDRWWNPAVEDQATDRAHRIGQSLTVQVHRLVAEGTVEDRIAALLSSKRDLADRVVGAGEAWVSELSDEELGQLVRLRRPCMDESLPLTVRDLHVGPGEAAGRVVGTGASHRVTIHVGALTDGAWDGVIGALAADPALVAAMLDGEVPATLTAAARPYTLEPSARELRSECTCRRRAEGCAHVGALWGEVLEELRRQPALLLALRGRGPASLASDARRLAALAARDQDAGADAAAAYERTARGLPGTPEVQTPAASSRPESWVEQDVLPHQRLLDQAADAASRALDILRGTGDGCLDLDRQTDVARIGSSLASPWDVSNLAWRAGMSPVELERLIRAWQARGSGQVTGVERSPVPASVEQLELFDG